MIKIFNDNFDNWIFWSKDKQIGKAINKKTKDRIAKAKAELFTLNKQIMLSECTEMAFDRIKYPPSVIIKYEGETLIILFSGDTERENFKTEICK